MMYDVPMTAVEKMESKISSSLRKWLGIPPSFSNIGLYGSETKLQLPFTALTEEFKVTKTRMAITIQTSSDDCVRKAGVTLPTGRKWAVQGAVDEATSRLKHRDIVGKVCIGRQGLGFAEAGIHNRWDTADCKERRKMVTDEVRNVEEEKRMARAVGMASQGA